MARIFLLLTVLFSAFVAMADGEILIKGSSGTLSASDIPTLNSPTDIVIGKDVKKIAGEAFADNNMIRSVSFEKGSRLKSIGEYAFMGCRNLVKIDFPESLAEIGESAFRECDSLEEVSLPDAVTVLPKNLFYWCESLKKVKLPARLKKISAHCFAYCRSLQNPDFPESLTAIGSNAFCYCESLKEAKIPDSVKELESYVFASCASLERVKLPANPSLLGELIFSSCPLLSSIEQLSPVPPEFDCMSFLCEPWDESFYSECKLYVAPGSLELYKKAHGWNLFRNISPVSKR